MRTTVLLAAADERHGIVQADGLTWSAPAVYAAGAQFGVIKG